MKTHLNLSHDLEQALTLIRKILDSELEFNQREEFLCSLHAVEKQIEILKKWEDER